MIHLIDGLPDSVVGIEASGTVSSDDYEAVVIPAIDEARKSGDGLRVIYVMGDGFEKFEAEAALDDMKMGVHNWTAFEKIALVTDQSSYRVMVKAMGFLMHGEVRVFAAEDLDEAKSWVAA